MRYLWILILGILLSGCVGSETGDFELDYTTKCFECIYYCHQINYTLKDCKEMCLNLKKLRRAK